MQLLVPDYSSFQIAFAVGCAKRKAAALAGCVVVSIVRRKGIGGKASTLCSDVRYLGFSHRLWTSIINTFSPSVTQQTSNLIYLYVAVCCYRFIKQLYERQLVLQFLLWVYLSYKLNVKWRRDQWPTCGPSISDGVVGRDETNIGLCVETVTSAFTFGYPRTCQHMGHVTVAVAQNILSLTLGRTSSWRTGVKAWVN